jgi:hypothetical protein
MLLRTITLPAKLTCRKYVKKNKKKIWHGFSLAGPFTRATNHPNAGTDELT